MHDALGTTDCIIFSYDASADTLQARAIFEVEATGYQEELHDPFAVDDYAGARDLLAHGGVIEEHISDPDLDAESRESMLEYNEMASLAVGIRFGDEALGLMALTESAHERRFSEAERQLAVALGEQAAIAMHTAAMLRRRDEQSAQLTALLESSRAVATAARLEDALTILARRVCEMLGSPQIIVYEYLRDRDAIVARAAYETEPSGWDRIGEALPLDDWPHDRQLLEEGGISVEHLSDPGLDPATRASMEHWGNTTTLAVPVRFGDEPVGIMYVFEMGSERVYTPRRSRSSRVSPSRRPSPSRARGFTETSRSRTGAWRHCSTSVARRRRRSSSTTCSTGSCGPRSTSSASTAASSGSTTSRARRSWSAAPPTPTATTRRRAPCGCSPSIRSSARSSWATSPSSRRSPIPTCIR